jgi:hypothetical protein
MPGYVSGHVAEVLPHFGRAKIEEVEEIDAASLVSVKVIILTTK